MCGEMWKYCFLLSPVTPPEALYGPSTKARQASQFWAVLSSWPHVWPIAWHSASRSLRQLSLGLPLFLFPCGFQRSACRVMFEAGFRSVWPIHLHRRLPISISIGCWAVSCHSSVFLIVSGHLILRIFLRHMFTEVYVTHSCSFPVFSPVI
jgi:hypothetical protein